MLLSPYIFIIANPFQCSTILRHTNDENPEGTVFCLFKSGSGVTQIQRPLNRDDFDVSRITTHYVKIQKRKTKKNTNSNRKNTWFVEDIPRLLPMWSRRSGL